jgi:hypothetical protein
MVIATAKLTGDLGSNPARVHGGRTLLCNAVASNLISNVSENKGHQAHLGKHGPKSYAISLPQTVLKWAWLMYVCY